MTPPGSSTARIAPAPSPTVRPSAWSPARSTCCVARRLADGERDRPSVLATAFADVEADYRRRADPALLAALEQLRRHAERKGRGWVIDSFWSAWDAFAQHETYRDAVIAAVRYGNDPDTTAAIAGGLAGIYWGLDESAGGIPAEWRSGLRDREQVAHILRARTTSQDLS